MDFSSLQLTYTSVLDSCHFHLTCGWNLRLTHWVMVETTQHVHVHTQTHTYWETHACTTLLLALVFMFTPLLLGRVCVSNQDHVTRYEARIYRDDDNPYDDQPNKVVFPDKVRWTTSPGSLTTLILNTFMHVCSQLESHLHQLSKVLFRGSGCHHHCMWGGMGRCVS